MCFPRLVKCRPHLEIRKHSRLAGSRTQSGRSREGRRAEREPGGLFRTTRCPSLALAAYTALPLLPPAPALDCRPRALEGTTEPYDSTAPGARGETASEVGKRRGALAKNAGLQVTLPGASRGPAPSLPWPRCPHRHRALACGAWVPPCPQRSRLQYERCPPSSPFRAQLRSRSRPEVQRRVCTDGRDHGTEDQRRGCEEATAPAADVYGRPGRPSLQVDVSNTRLSDASLRLQPAAPTLPQNCNL